MEKDLRDWDSQDRGRTETESKERDILIEGAIMELARNLAVEKCPRTHRDEPG